MDEFGEKVVILEAHFDNVSVNTLNKYKERRKYGYKTHYFDSRCTDYLIDA